MAARVAWTARADWFKFYRITLPNGTVVTYGDDRTWSGDVAANEVWPRANALKALGMLPAHRILIVGAGMGFLIETLKLVGLPNVWGLDNSAWCQARKATVNANVVLINADFTGSANSLRNTFNTATGARTFDWIVTESVLESFNDADVGIIVAQGPNLLANGVPASRCVHLVYTPPFNAELAGLFNEKTMAQWRAMAPAQTWMNAEGYAVQGA